MFVLVWEFEVRPDRVGEFERAYGPHGEWVTLFQDGAGYLGTEFLRDEARPHTYLTLDRWESVAAYDAFRAARAAAYAAIDARCEGLTVSERRLGGFGLVQ